jgi:hypothetical protein
MIPIFLVLSNGVVRLNSFPLKSNALTTAQQ